MFSLKGNASLAASLVLAVFLWGGNNAGTKFLVAVWPPIGLGCARFLLAGLLLLALLRMTTWLGVAHKPGRELNQRLWLRGGLSLAAYIVAFNYALRFTSASRIALYLAAAPVWALVWEGLPDRSWRSAQRYGAALLALAGVAVLVGPAILAGGGRSYLAGDLLGIIASVIWTKYGRDCRALGAELSGAEISAHTMWRAGVWLLPFALVEVARNHLPVDVKLLSVFGYCVVAGGVMAFALWNNALRHWPASRVLLFNNLIPISTMTWAYFTLGEHITPTFWLAMVLIISGVVLGQTSLNRFTATKTSAPAQT